MFSLIQKISRIYAITLVLLLVIVTISSCSLVSMVRNYYIYNDILKNISDQRENAQNILIGLSATNKQNASKRARTNALTLQRLYLENLKTLHMEYNNFSSKLGKPRAHISPELESILSQEWDKLSLSHFMSRFIGYTELIFNDFEQNLDTDNSHFQDSSTYTDLMNLTRTIGIKRLSMGYNTIQGLAARDFQWHKNIMLLCVFLFISLIAFEAFMIYRPFSKRIQSKINALEKEQEIVTQTMQTLQQDEERLKLAMQGIDMGIFEWQITDDVLYLSKSGHRVLNMFHTEINIDDNTYDPPCTSLNQLKECLDTSDRKKFETMLSHHLDHNRIFNIDVKLPDDHYEDSYKWVNIRGQAEWNDMKEAVRFAGVLREITAEKKVEDLKHMFMTGIESSHLPMAIIDVRHFGRQFLYASPGLCTLLEYDLEHLLKSNMYMLNGPDTKLEHIDQVENIFESNQSGEVNIIHYKANGTPFMDHMKFTPIHDQDNAIIAYVTFHEDTSEAQQRTDHEVERQRSEAVGKLAQKVSEEALSLLKELEFNQKNANDEAKIKRLKAMHKGILGFFSTGSNNTEYFNPKTEIAAIIESNITLYDHRIKWDVTIDLEYDDFMTHVNKAELRQVVHNIIKNAYFSYSQDSAIDKNTDQMYISFRAQYDKLSIVDAQKIGLPPHSQNYMIITIADKGLGMDHAGLEQAFTPLFSNWSRDQTSGLGLTVARGLLRSWGGEIIISSQLHEGTKVKIYVPVYASNEDKDFMEMSSLLDELNASGTEI